MHISTAIGDVIPRCLKSDVALHLARQAAGGMIVAAATAVLFTQRRGFPGS